MILPDRSHCAAGEVRRDLWMAEAPGDLGVAAVTAGFLFSAAIEAAASVCGTVSSH